MQSNDKRISARKYARSVKAALELPVSVFTVLLTITVIVKYYNTLR